MTEQEQDTPMEFESKRMGRPGLHDGTWFGVRWTRINRDGTQDECIRGFEKRAQAMAHMNALYSAYKTLEEDYRKRAHVFRGNPIPTITPEEAKAMGYSAQTHPYLIPSELEMLLRTVKDYEKRGRPYELTSRGNLCIEIWAETLTLK